MKSKAKRVSKLRFKKRSDEIKERVPHRRVIYLSVLINTAVIIILFIGLNRLPPEIPLYYGLPEGSGQIAERSYLVVPSLLTLVFIFINTIIVVLIENIFLKTALIVTCLMLSVFSLVTTVKIMLLVGLF